MSIEVTRMSDDQLARQRWRFFSDGGAMRLSSYFDEVRRSRRHRTWAVVHVFRGSNPRQYAASQILHAAPHVPEDVVAEALAGLRAQITWTPQ